MTVLLGTKQDWVLVGGHVFILRSDGDHILELMPEDQMWPDPKMDKRRRVKELWKWDEKGTLKQQHRSIQLRNMKTWRR